MNGISSARQSAQSAAGAAMEVLCRSLRATVAKRVTFRAALQSHLRKYESQNNLFGVEVSRYVDLL
jgi:hypothetical protein